MITQEVQRNPHHKRDTVPVVDTDTSHPILMHVSTHLSEQGEARKSILPVGIVRHQERKENLCLGTIRRHITSFVMLRL